MMSCKVLWVLALVMLALPAAGAEPACSEPDLAWLLSPPPLPSDLAPTPIPIDLSTERRQGPFVRCSATALCTPYASVSCSNGSGTCVAVDRNCGVGQRGYVTCNGATTYCPICGCPEGEYQWVWGGCCGGGKNKSREQVCQNGVWVNTGVIECEGSCF